MSKIALTAAALLVATGAAFAGSDHFDPANINAPAASVDTSYTGSTKYTASTKKSDADVRKPVIVQIPATTGADHNLFGNN